MSFNFHVNVSPSVDLEIMQVDRLSIPRDFVVPGLSAIYLPSFAGMVRLNEGVFSQQQMGARCFLVPDGGSLVIESLSSATDLIFVSILRQTKISWDHGVGVEVIAEEDQHSIVGLLDEILSQSNEAALEVSAMKMLDLIRSSLHRSSSVMRSKRLFQSSVDIFEKLRVSDTFDFGIGDLCDDLGVHISQASREFRQTFGLPPYRYWVLLRLARARKALIGPSPAASVGYDFGFADQSHFYSYL